MSLYLALLDANVEVQGHESELFFIKSKKSMDILEKFPESAGISTTFLTENSTDVMIEVPFAFDPFFKLH